jgi:hypothetical protein
LGYRRIHLYFLFTHEIDFRPSKQVTLAMINMDKPNEERIQMLTDGMEILLGVLGNVVTGVGQERH